MLRLDEVKITSNTEIGIKITRFTLDLEREVLRVEYVTLDENEKAVEQKFVRIQGKEVQDMINENAASFQTLKVSIYNKLIEKLGVNGSVE